jgi:hypothetical protein
MNFVSPEAGQTIQLWMLDEMRPLRGGVFMPDVITNVVRRYRFASFPKEFNPGQTLKFEWGVSAGPEDLPITINSLEIFNDGVIVIAGHTDDADIIMDDLFAWLKSEWRLREPQTPIPRRYHSRVVVEFDEGLDYFIKNVEACSATVAQAMGVTVPMHIARLAFAVEPSVQAFTSWQIEARVGAPFEANRYFSAAPLPTNAHVDMLAAIERAVRTPSASA